MLVRYLCLSDTPVPGDVHCKHSAHTLGARTPGALSGNRTACESSKFDALLARSSRCGPRGAPTAHPECVRLEFMTRGCALLPPPARPASIPRMGPDLVPQLCAHYAPSAQAVCGCRVCQILVRSPKSPRSEPRHTLRVVSVDIDAELAKFARFLPKSQQNRASSPQIVK